MTTIKVSFNNDNNAKTVIAWLRQNGVQVEVLENGFPTLENENVSNTKVNTERIKKHFNTDIPEIKDDKETKIGEFVTAYPTHKAVRHFQKGVFTPQKIKNGIAYSLTQAGATWDKELHAYTFKTKKDFDAWCKEQKNRATK